MNKFLNLIVKFQVSYMDLKYLSGGHSLLDTLPSPRFEEKAWCCVHSAQHMSARVVKSSQRG